MSKREFLKILMGLGTDKRFKNLFTKYELDLLKGILEDIDNISQKEVYYEVIKAKSEQQKSINNELQEKLNIYEKSLNIINILSNNLDK